MTNRVGWAPPTKIAAWHSMPRRWWAAPTLLLLAAAQPAVAVEKPDGFESIMPGEDLAGWVGGTTIHPEKIAPDKQAEWDAQVREHWRVEGDQVVSDGHGPHLVTERKYRDFELLVDWNLAPGGDSGVYLRDTPQVQIWDPENTAAHKNGSDKGSGGLWNNREQGKWPLAVADRPTGQWNRMYVRMVGPYVRVVLNDQLVVEDAPLENYFDRAAPVLEEGRIHLQTHGSETRFRRILVREIEQPEAQRLIAAIRGRTEP